MAMTLRLTDEQTERLREAAARDGLSMQAAAIKAVDDYATDRKARRREILTEMMRKHGDLLDRLADA